MPNTQPSSAPRGDAARSTDDLTAAAVLHDDSTDRPVGGGTLGTGAGVAGQIGAETPNSPMSAPVPQAAGDAKAEAEARALSTDGPAPEPGHTSQ